jgi:hypothetical protein
VFPGVRESFLRIPLEQDTHVSSVAAEACIAVAGTGAYSSRPVVRKSQRTSSMA